MSLQRLEPGQLIRFDHGVHRVEAIRGSLVTLRDRATDSPWIAYAVTLFADADFAVGTDLDEPPPRTAEADRADTQDLDRMAMLKVLDPHLLAEVRRREHMIRRLLNRTAAADVAAGDATGVTAANRATLDDPPGGAGDFSQRVAAQAAEFGVNRATVFRWIARYRTDGAWALVDQRKLRGSLQVPLANVDPRLVAAARTQIAAVEMQDATGAAPFARFCRRLQSRVDDMYGAGVVVLPPRSTMHRIYAALTLGVLGGSADRRKTTALQPNTPYGHATALRPGEVVMFDSTTFDVLAYDPLTDTTSAIEVSLAIDVAPRSILAWRFTPRGATGTDAALLLADTMTPEPMRPGWKESLSFGHLSLACDRLVALDERLEHAAARPFVIAETVNVDHGKIYVGKVFTAACERLGISIQPARKARPTDKAIVERVFATVNAGFAQHVAGYKGRRVADRGIAPEGDALWTIAELEEFFAEWVVSVYSRRAHRSLVLPGELTAKWCPNDAYAEAVARAGWLPVPNEPDLYFDLLPVVWRVANRAGFEVKNLTYWDPAVNGLDQVQSPYPDTGGRRGKWPLRVDPRNPMTVFLKLTSGPRRGDWVALRWTHAPDMLAPFTDVSLSFVRRQLRLRGLNPKDQDEVARALIDLQNRTDAPWASTAATRRALTRDRERARTASRDQARARLALDDIDPPEDYDADGLIRPPIGAGNQEDAANMANLNDDSADDSDLYEPFGVL